MNAFKFNVDGSARGKPGPAGTGGVLRDFKGKVICLFSFYVGISDSNAAELMAIHKAMEICSFDPYLRGQSVSIVSDSKVAVSWINKGDFGSLEHFSLISFIRQQLEIMKGFEVVHASRSYNSFADNLAKMGSNSCGDFLHWM